MCHLGYWETFPKTKLQYLSAKGLPHPLPFSSGKILFALIVSLCILTTVKFRWAQNVEEAPAPTGTPGQSLAQNQQGHL